MKRLFIIAALLLLLGGCRAEPRTPRFRVVSGIDVTYSHDAQVTHHTYHDQPRIRAILNYLRTLDTYAPVPISPDTFRGDAFRITLHRSDGTTLTYHQIADGYLQRGDGPWEKTDARHASRLLRMLQQLES